MSGGQRPRSAIALASIVVVVLIAIATHHTKPLNLVLAIVIAPFACSATAIAAKQLGGSRFGFAASVVYVALPILGIAYSFSSYRHTFIHRALPELVGLEAPGWLALGVLLVGAIAIAPRLAFASAGVVASAVALSIWGVHALVGVRGGLHETAWSITLLEWLVVAGVVGAARRSLRLALSLGGILIFFALRAAHGGYDDGVFWRSLAPATPAIAVLISSLWLLVPRLRPEPARHAE